MDQPCVEKLFIMSPPEFLVLAATAGIDIVPSLFRRRCSLTEEDIYYARFHLAVRGILAEDGRMDEEYSSLFSAVREAVRVIYVKCGSELEYGAEDLIVYVSDSCVAGKISKRDQDRISLSMEKPETFIRRLQEEGILPEPGMTFSDNCGMTGKDGSGMMRWKKGNPLESLASIDDNSRALKAAFSVYDPQKACFVRTWIWMRKGHEEYLFSAGNDGMNDKSEGKEGCRQLLNLFGGGNKS